MKKIRRTFSKKFLKLQRSNQESIQNFNEKWEVVIEQLTDYSARVEEDLRNQHMNELEQFDEDFKLLKQRMKYSSKILNSRFRLKQLIRSRKYAEAKYIKAKIAMMEEKDRGIWDLKHQEKKIKKKKQLIKRHTNEKNVSQSRLEKMINERLK